MPAFLSMLLRDRLRDEAAGDASVTADQCLRLSAPVAVRRTGAGSAGAVVLDLDLRAAHRVLDGLGPLPDVLVDDHLFLDPGFFGDNGLLRALRGVDRPIAVVLVTLAGRSTGRRST
jgi:hypothetical protein